MSASPPSVDRSPATPVVFDPVVLHTTRTIVRPLGDDDVDALFTLYADAAALRFWSTPPWTDREQATGKIARDRRHLADGLAIGLGIEDRDRGALVGTCSLHAFHHASHRCEVGYLLARAQWGRGLAHEAVGALVAYGFATLGLHRIEADIDPANVASARVLERLGFEREGLLRERWLVAGRWSDSVIYGRLVAADPAGR